MDIKQLLPKIQENAPLSQFTTFHIGGPARYFYVAKSGDDLITAVDAARKCGIPIFILGAGSNLLVSDKGFEGLVIKIQMSKSKFQIKPKIQNPKIYVESGVFLGFAAKKAAETGLSGMEWAGGIPGTMGGAIRGNAGAFGGSMADIVETVNFLEISEKNRDPKVRSCKNKNCEFGYRNSIFKKNPNLIILSAILRLKTENKEKVLAKTKEYLEYRRSRHPLKYPSAGSIFKNQKLDIPCLPAGRKNKKLFKQFPDLRQFEARGDIPAAYLISECGLKGEKVGGAMVSDEHPNFIINIGNAKAQDVSELIKLIKKKVKNKFGIALEEEIQYVGFNLNCLRLNGNFRRGLSR